MMDEYVLFPKSLFQEFIVLWGQVESISPTFSNAAQKLIGKVKNTIGKIKTQVRSSECENPGSAIIDQPSSPPDTDMLPDNEVPSREEAVPSVMHDTEQTDETESMTTPVELDPIPMDTTPVSEIQGSKRVQKRKRRVASKTKDVDQRLQNSNDQEQLPELDFTNLQNPKYLKEMLAKVKSPSNKAKIYLEYLRNCHFNRDLEPTSIIHFSPDDVITLSGIEENPERATEVLAKLRKALQQRFQLAIQQSCSIGYFLSECISRHRRTSRSEYQDERRRGRPKMPLLLDILDNIESLSTSSSTLQDHILLNLTVSDFPMLSYVNEPMSHFLNSEVKTAVAHLADRIHLECRAPDNMHETCLQGPYPSTVSNTESPALSGSIPYNTVTACDGDGLVENIDVTDENPLRNAVYTRLNGIDAPELSTVHFFKTQDLSHVFVKRIGHLSLCGLHFFLRMFSYHGSASLCAEIQRDEYDAPVDYYNRPLKEYWFRFPNPAVTEHERTFLNYFETLVSEKPEMRERLMSPFPVTEASASEPFLISLNALLVLTGFCHVFTRFSPDNRMLGLQRIAKENKIGPLWCGASRNYIFGARSNNTEDIVLQHFNGNSTQTSSIEKFLPWHERKAIKKLCSPKTTRSEANDNMTKAMPGREPHCGVFIDISSSSNPEDSAHYRTTITGEAYLFVSKSRVIGVGGVDTGLGLFTLKEIPPNTFVCSYAPTASLRATTQYGDYAMELTVGGERISVNGQESEHEIGLGIYANDGTFPFNLVGEKFSRSVTERINCKFSKRNNEVWLKSTRPIHANEELLVSYTPDGSYWTSLFTQDQLDKIKDALAKCGPTLKDAEDCILLLKI